MDDALLQKLQNIAVIRAAMVDKVQMKRTVIHAAAEMHRRFGTTRRPSGGITPRDVVIDSFLDVLAAPDKWDPQRGSIWTYLWTIIDSKILRLATKPDEKLTRWWSNDSVDDAAAVRGVSPPNQYDRVLLKETQIRLFEMTSENDEARKVAEAMLNGETKPQKIASETGVNVVEVYSIQRRVRRNLLAHMKPSDNPTMALAAHLQKLKGDR